MTREAGFCGLSGNVLKIIAVISMTIDHIGVSIFPHSELLRIIGRLAYPIFAYMIAEGCTYTRSKTKHLFSVGAVAFLCQLVYYFVMKSLYMCIFVTFSLSIILIYAIDYAIKTRRIFAAFIAVFTFSFVLFITEGLPRVLTGTDFCVDYGFFGVFLPVLVYFAKGRAGKLIAAFAGLLALALTYGGTQWFSLSALVLLVLYNGKRGKLKLKSFFYIYYPVHLVIIYLISALIYDFAI